MSKLNEAFHNLNRNPFIEKISLIVGLFALILIIGLKYYIVIFLLGWIKKFLFSTYIEFCASYQFIKSAFRTLTNPGQFKFPIWNWKIPNFFNWVLAALDLILGIAHFIIGVAYFIALCVTLLPINFVLQFPYFES